LTARKVAVNGCPGAKLLYSGRLSRLHPIPTDRAYILCTRAKSFEMIGFDLPVEGPLPDPQHLRRPAPVAPVFL
jgi:hypothetical protein